MSRSSPSDLAVTFRSVPRRLREAQGDAAAAVTEPFQAEIRRQLSRAADAMRTTADPIRIGDEIDSVPPDAWDVPTLDQLRDIALEIGKLLRETTAAAEGQDPE